MNIIIKFSEQSIANMLHKRDESTLKLTETMFRAQPLSIIPKTQRPPDHKRRAAGTLARISTYNWGRYCCFDCQKQLKTSQNSTSTSKVLHHSHSSGATGRSELPKLEMLILKRFFKPNLLIYFLLFGAVHVRGGGGGRALKDYGIQN